MKFMKISFIILSCFFIPSLLFAYFPPGASISKATQARINQGGYDILVDEFESYITQAELQAQMLAANPLFDEEIEEWGFTIASAIVNSEYLTMVEPVDITIDPQPGSIFGSITIWDMNIGVEAHGEIMEIPWSSHGTVFADRITVEGNVYVEVYNGQFRVTMPYVYVYMYGFGFDINNFPDELEQLFYDTVGDLVKDIIEEEVKAELPIAIQDLLNELPYEGDFSIQNIIFNYNLDPENVYLYNSGTTVGLKGSIVYEQFDNCVAKKPGSKETPGDPPAFGPTVPGMPQKTYDFGLTVSDDFLNQALFSAHQGGLFCIPVEDEELTTTLLRLLLPELYEIAPDAPILLNMNAYQVPYIALGQPGQDLLNLYIKNFILDGYVLFEERFTRAFGILMDARIGMSLEITPYNTIKLHSQGMEMTATLYFEELVDLNNAVIEVLVPILVEFLFPRLIEIIEEIPLPVFEGYNLDVLSIQANGSVNDYLSVYANLTKVQ